MLTTMLAVASAATLANENTVTQPTVYQEAYALYVLKNPNNKAQSSKVLIEQYQQDYAELFKQHKKGQ